MCRCAGPRVRPRHRLCRAFRGETASARDLFDQTRPLVWQDLHDGLAGVYPPTQAAELVERLIRSACRTFVERSPELAYWMRSAVWPRLVPITFNARLRGLRRPFRRKHRRRAGKDPLSQGIGCHLSAFDAGAAPPRRRQRRWLRAGCRTRTNTLCPRYFSILPPGNFSYDEELKAWVWTTFNSF